jgi:hypothetical protein
MACCDSLLAADVAGIPWQAVAGGCEGRSGRWRSNIDGQRGSIHNRLGEAVVYVRLAVAITGITQAFEISTADKHGSSSLAKQLIDLNHSPSLTER